MGERGGAAANTITKWTAQLLVDALASDATARTVGMAYDTRGRKTDVCSPRVHYYATTGCYGAEPVECGAVRGDSHTIMTTTCSGIWPTKARRSMTLPVTPGMTGAGGPAHAANWRDTWHYYDVMGPREPTSIHAATNHAQLRSTAT